MAELRILFDTPPGGGLHVRLVPAGADPRTQVARPFAFDLTDDERGELRWYLEDYMDLPDYGSRVRAEKVEGRIDAWGRALHDALFGDEPFAKMLADLDAAPPPRLLTVASDDARVLRLPWELMADTRGALAHRLTLRRQLPAAQPAASFEAELPLRILLIVSRPDDLDPIDPRHTTRALLDALEPLGRDNLDVDFCRPPTLARLEEMLTEAERDRRPYAIVHFDGHGTYDATQGLGLLCFEQAHGAHDAGAPPRTHAVRADTLGNLLSAQRVPLVILEACRSGQVDAVALRSVAPRLLAAGISGVVAMSHAVHIEATRILLERFYRDLVSGATVGAALGGGRAALMSTPQRWLELGPGAREVELRDWFLPQLYQRGDDVRLVPPASARAAIRPAGGATGDDGYAWDVFLSHTHADSARVEALATRLRDRHGLRVWLDLWQARPGPIHLACEQGIRDSRIVALVCSRAALDSDWVEAERQLAYARDPRGLHVLPLLLEDVALPPALAGLRRVDLRDPAHDEARAAELAALIGAPGVTAARDGQRPLALRGSLGAFPAPPVYRFHGRARELHRLEQVFRDRRAVLLHAMGGMGKTALAREAAHWWTRTGLFPDGACFLSFETRATAERVVQVLGTYFEGPAFEARPQAQQREIARRWFHERDVLMVWDNFESVLPQFDERRDSPLADSAALPALRELFDEWTEDERGRGRLLVTCRPAETGLARARRVELHGLARPDSLWLLHQVVRDAGAEPKDLARDDLRPLLDTLGDHPLSIALVAPHLKTMAPRAIVERFAEPLPRIAGDADVERNRSLLASLRFSTDRLSPAARAALPWLGLFRVGVFEDNLLDVSQIAPEAWGGIRAELEGTALVRVESEWQVNDRPYLRFHPTLPWAAAVVAGEAEGTTVRADVPGVRARYVAVYDALDTVLRNALHSSQARGAMEVLAREEGNFRTAVEWAVDDGRFDVAAPMGQTFRDYLERCNLSRERERWAAWLAEAGQQAAWTEAAAGAECNAAWALFTQGHGAEALRRLEALIERLRGTTEFDPAFDLAFTKQWLGRTLYSSGDSPRAIPVLREALRDWETLCDQAGVGALARGETPAGATTQPQTSPDDTQLVCLGNLSATLGSLANAIMSAGQLDEALDVADRALRLDRHLGRDRDVAAGLGQTAQILTDAGRYDEAQERYEEAISVARRCGDRELEAAGLQHSGGLANDRHQHGRAVEAYTQALKLFQEAGNDVGVMQTCNLLGRVEQGQGRLPEARAWYARSREIAGQRGDKQGLSLTAQNLGIVCQVEGQRALEQGGDATTHFEQAERFILEGLQLRDAQRDEPGRAASHSQLGQIYRLMGDLDRAEAHAQRAREIHECLRDARGLSFTYKVLKEIAQARGDAAQTAHWQAKEAEVDAELARRAGGGDGRLPRQLLDALTALAVTCVQAAAQEIPLPDEARQVVDQLASPDAGPLQPLGAYLRRLATTPPAQLAEVLAAPPDGLPDELTKLFGRLRDAVAEAGLG